MRTVGLEKGSRSGLAYEHAAFLTFCLIYNSPMAFMPAGFLAEFWILI
jgi:hypothetical protein